MADNPNLLDLQQLFDRAIEQQIQTKLKGGRGRETPEERASRLKLAEEEHQAALQSKERNEIENINKQQLEAAHQRRLDWFRYIAGLVSGTLLLVGFFAVALLAPKDSTAASMAETGLSVLLGAIAGYLASGNKLPTKPDANTPQEQPPST